MALRRVGLAFKQRNSDSPSSPKNEYHVGIKRNTFDSSIGQPIAHISLVLSDARLQRARGQRITDANVPDGQVAAGAIPEGHSKRSHRHVRSS